MTGPADADVDHGLDLLAGHALPFAGTDLVGEGVHAVEGLAHVLDHVLTIHDQLAFVAGVAAQCGVQHGAVLGVVDVHAGVHVLGALLEVDLIGELCEQCEGLRLDQVLREVEAQRAHVERQRVHARGIVLEPLLEIDALCLQLVIVLLQLLPRRGARGVDRRIDCHS